MRTAKRSEYSPGKLSVDSFEVKQMQRNLLLNDIVCYHGGPISPRVKMNVMNNNRFSRHWL